MTTCLRIFTLVLALTSFSRTDAASHEHPAISQKIAAEYIANALINQDFSKYSKTDLMELKLLLSSTEMELSSNSLAFILKTLFCTIGAGLTLLIGFTPFIRYDSESSAHATDMLRTTLTPLAAAAIVYLIFQQEPSHASEEKLAKKLNVDHLNVRDILNSSVLVSLREKIDQALSAA